MALPFLPIKEGTKTQIIELLGKMPSLSAKKIFFEIKKQYGKSVTYQAIHKTLQNLTSNEIITKEKKEYSLNKEWLEKIERFCDEVREVIKDRKAVVSEESELKIKSDKKIKVIGFNLDASLSDITFDELFWRMEIPKYYAKQNDLSFEEAYKKVTKEYRRLWGKVNRWRDPQFWVEHFDFRTNWKELIKGIKKEIKFYGDVVPVLKELSKNYILVIISRADRKFLNLKLETGRLNKFFDHTFSTISDFGVMNKEAEVYKQVCKKLNIQPSELVYIGNDYEHDYHLPNMIGIKSFLLDREGNKKEEYIVRDLYELQEKIEKFS